MKSTLEQEPAVTASKYHVANEKGIYADAEQVFVPLPGGGNICHFLLAHVEGGFIGGYKFFIRSPRNLIEVLPAVGFSVVTTREHVLATLFETAWKFFSDHKTALAHLSAWAIKSPLVESELRENGFPFLVEKAVPPINLKPVAAVVDDPSVPAVVVPVETAPTESRRSRFDSIAVADIETNPQNPRKVRTELSLEELTESIRAQGELLQPIAVRDMGGLAAGKRYRLIFGEGRWLAHQRLKWEKIDAKIYSGLTAADALAKALVENLSREDMNAMDEAEGFAELSHLGWDPKRMAEGTGKAERTIRSALGLVKLPEEVRALVRQGELSARQARTLVGWVSPHGGAVDFVARPEVCAIIAKTASKSACDISSDKLTDGIPYQAVSPLVAAKLLVEIPRGYVGDVELGTVYFRIAEGVYTFDAAAWKDAKKSIDAAAKAAAAAAKDKAASKIASRVSVPVADLTKANVQHAELSAEDERYADFLPEGAITTGIASDKREVLICVQPEALRQIKVRESSELMKNRRDCLPAVRDRATAQLRKLKKIGAREMAFIFELSLGSRIHTVSASDEAFQLQGAKVPKDLTKETLAKVDPVVLMRIYLQAALFWAQEADRDCGGVDRELPILRWILDTPKLGLIQEDEKARATLLERLSADLWPKSGAPVPLVSLAKGPKETKGKESKGGK